MDKPLPDLSILRRCWPEYADATTTHEVTVAGVAIGGPHAVVIAGPCAVESFGQTLKIARAVRQAGGRLMRGGAYKPRTNPHSFQGLGAEGLEILAEVRRLTGVGIVTEVMDPRLVGEVAAVADMLQIGSRSMQNFPLLKEVGQTRVPILLKRGWSATLEEWLCAAEYVAMGGNRDIVLCERGIRGSCHQDYGRNILDLNIIEPLRRATPLPVIVDPSHATGAWNLVSAMSRAGLATGAHGLLIEVAEPGGDRSKQKCDREQGICTDTLADIVAITRAVDVPPVTELVLDQAPS
jgi:3-deoxy-7-phosphoheptulonate synthase